MSYKLELTSLAFENVKKLKSEEPKAYFKFLKLSAELKEHPTTGTGKPEYLKYDPRGVWSRRITKKHRMIYKILDDQVIVQIISVYGHYGDK